MKCLNCTEQAKQNHHVIRRNKVQCGTDHPCNLAPLCAKCHDILHFSKDTQKRNEIKAKCYDWIRPNLDKCWSAKIKPKIVRLIESGNL